MLTNALASMSIQRSTPRFSGEALPKHFEDDFNLFMARLNAHGELDEHNNKRLTLSPEDYPSVTIELLALPHNRGLTMVHTNRRVGIESTYRFRVDGSLLSKHAAYTDPYRLTPTGPDPVSLSFIVDGAKSVLRAS
jgi:hypothetical protein